MIAASIETLGELNGHVINAGPAAPTAPVKDADPAQWAAVMTDDFMETFHFRCRSITHFNKAITPRVRRSAAQPPQDPARRRFRLSAVPACAIFAT